MHSNKKEIVDVLHEEIKKRNWNMRQAGVFFDVNNTNLYTLMKEYKGVSFDRFIDILDKLDLKLVVEDKDAKWGEDMARLRMMPKKLFTTERVENRELVKKHGFHPRVDLFASPEIALKFIGVDCDVYEISLGLLMRRKFDVVEHPFGTIYSYTEHIPAESIRNWTTHRQV
jgi:hypothetical protein